MSTQRFHQTMHIKAPVETVFALFADHAQFARLLGGRATRIKDGQGGNPNGLGSVRRVPLIGLEETVVRFEPSKAIDYAITRGGAPLRNHLGQIRFTPQGNGTHITYTIAFDSAIDVIAIMVGKLLTAGWKRNAPRILSALER
jgi:uncharacterized protein YndB with AHSA1/START domain